MDAFNKYEISNKLSTCFYYFAILFFIIGFGFRDTPTPFGWYQQFMPNLNGRQIVDITFTDSLTGYAITNYLNDTSFILKTTTSGDSWFYSHNDTGIANYYRIQFINQNTGFIGGYIDRNFFVKTTNAGLSWFYINSAYDQIALDMSIINENTIWFADGGSLTGGVFRTTNGGISWDHQINLGSANPDHIYMYNTRIGFISKSNSYTRKSTDGGQTWTLILSGSGMGFYQMFFIDSLTGWANIPNIRKTTDGGFNWIQQNLPHGGNIISSGFAQFTVLNKDTIWGAGGDYITPNGFRSMVYKTENGGINWLFQVPDTSINIWPYDFCKFINFKTGWVYNTGRGIHTTTGGDTNWLTGLIKISGNIPAQFKLYQNYPNPFNPRTIIKYQITSNVKRQTSNVNINVYDISGKLLTSLVNEKQGAGTYEVDFSGNGYSTGVYFYKLMVSDKSNNIIFIETKKMILIK